MPLRHSRFGTSFEKRICETLDKPYYDKMLEKLKSPYAKKMKKLRQSTVEPVLGTEVSFLGTRRVNTRGLAQANKCLILDAVAYNIKKFIGFSKIKSEIMTMRVRDKAPSAYNLFFSSKGITIH